MKYKIFSNLTDVPCGKPLEYLTLISLNGSRHLNLLAPARLGMSLLDEVLRPGFSVPDEHLQTVATALDIKWFQRPLGEGICWSAEGTMPGTRKTFSGSGPTLRTAIMRAIVRRNLGNIQKSIPLELLPPDIDGLHLNPPQLKEVRQLLGLLNSMILSGEQHSPSSQAALDKVRTILNPPGATA